MTSMNSKSEQSKRTDRPTRPEEHCLCAVSACLAGIPCRYDGKSQGRIDIAEMVAAGRAVTICPECLGGLPIPRIPAEIVGGSGEDVLDGKARVIAWDGAVQRDVTEQFVNGAHRALEILKELKITEVLLKANSPSCGCGVIYDGAFSGSKKAGNGVAAALLVRNGIRVHSV